MKIALIGYGKMGRMVERIALSRGHEIVCKIDVDNQQDFDSEAFASADVAIEFTNPTAAFDNYCRAFKHNVKVVSGSTGWMKDHKAEVERMTREGGQTLFWASNFSVGVAIFAAVNKYLARIMNGFAQYDVRMERHTMSISLTPHPVRPSLWRRILSRASTAKLHGNSEPLLGTTAMWTETTTMRIKNC